MKIENKSSTLPAVVMQNYFTKLQGVRIRAGFSNSSGKELLILCNVPLNWTRNLLPNLLFPYLSAKTTLISSQKIKLPDCRDFRVVVCREKPNNEEIIRLLRPICQIDCSADNESVIRNINPSDRNSLMIRIANEVAPLIISRGSFTNPIFTAVKVNVYLSNDEPEAEIHLITTKGAIRLNESGFYEFLKNSGIKVEIVYS